MLSMAAMVIFSRSSVLTNFQNVCRRKGQEEKVVQQAPQWWCPAVQQEHVQPRQGWLWVPELYG